jgi:hypothetical protein
VSWRSAPESRSNLIARYGIAGAGTRITLYLTLGYLISPQGLLGFWAKKAIGNRDVPGGLLLLNLCLSIALCFQLRTGKAEG